jgi:hypothetical protein
MLHLLTLSQPWHILTLWSRSFPIWVAGWTACLWTLCFGAFVGTLDWSDWSDWGGTGTKFPPFPVCGKAEMSAAEGGEVMVLAETSLDGEGGRATSSASRGSLLEAMAGEAAARAREPREAAAAPDSNEPKPRSLERTVHREVLWDSWHSWHSWHSTLPRRPRLVSRLECVYLSGKIHGSLAEHKHENKHGIIS